MKIKYTFAAAAVLTAAAGIAAAHGGAVYVDTAECSIATGNAALKSINIYGSTLDTGTMHAIEDYLTGVVAAEMPAASGEEALKAQAVAARTYALRALENDPSLEFSDIGQAYISDDTMRKRWGGNYRLYLDKIKNAVSSTGGIILLYEGKPILAAFCASSGGMTEESSTVWGQPLPYLVNVDSHWDSEAEGFAQTLTLSKGDVIDLFGGIPEITSRSQAGYVQSVYAGGKSFSGIEVRQILGLRSADFTLTVSGENVYITTKGYGHGVGMSQTGAAGMAAEGSTYEEILAHYYPGTEFAVIKGNSPKSPCVG